MMTFKKFGFCKKPAIPNPNLMYNAPYRNREKDIRPMREEGKTIDEIADSLGISRSSVYNYMGKGRIK